MSGLRVTCVSVCGGGAPIQPDKWIFSEKNEVCTVKSEHAEEIMYVIEQ